MRMKHSAAAAHFAETGPNITEVNETLEYDTSAIQGPSRAENPVRNSVQNRPWPSRLITYFQSFHPMPPRITQQSCKAWSQS
jgi:hypothetical protein